MNRQTLGLEAAELADVASRACADTTSTQTATPACEREYFVVSFSHAAPLVGDMAMAFVRGTSPTQALDAYAARYAHPCGLARAALWDDANAYYRGSKALAVWAEPGPADALNGGEQATLP